jgi:DNA repair protein RadA/Sms
LAEVDRVLDGGLSIGSVTLLGGEPGSGKSTLVLQMAAHVAMSGHRALYISGEESAPQVRGRADRIQALVDGLWLAAEHDLEHVLDQIAAVQPDLVVVDSVQAISDPALPSGPGSTQQVRAVAEALVRTAKADGPAVILVGQVTKDGDLAGPRSLEHVVDTVLLLEGDHDREVRLLRSVKHRFGSTGNLGVFEMTEHGVLGVADPSALFLADRRPATVGSAIVAVIDGHRPLLVEVQALLVPGVAGTPRRTTQGLDTSRLHLLLAVLERHLGLATTGTEVYAATAGGVRVTDPGADLGVLLALASAHLGQPLPDGMVVYGEVGLGGEVRRVRGADRRLAEAARLGFGFALVPDITVGALPAGCLDPTVDSPGTRSEGIGLLGASDLVEAVAQAGLLPVPVRAP